MTSSNAVAKKSVRLEAVDGLRGLAALLVLLSHVEWTNHLTRTTFVINGYLAVDLFFILSGLVIASNYAETLANLPKAVDFIVLRMFRLYPLHLVTLLTLVGLECLKVLGQRRLGFIPAHQPFTGGESYGMLIANLLLVQGLGWVRAPNWNFASWSISCEFFAYLLFALSALTGMLRLRLFFVCGAVVAITSYATMAFTRGTLDLRFDFGMVRCLSGFLLGLLIFRFPGPMQLRPQQKREVLQVAIAVAVILSMAYISGPMIATVIPLFVTLVALIHSDSGPVARLLRSRPARFLGRVSYSIYMVHGIVIVSLLMVMKRWLPMTFDSKVGRTLVTINPWSGDVLVIAFVVTVLTVSSITYRFIEEPGRMFGRKIISKTEPIDSHVGAVAARA